MCSQLKNVFSLYVSAQKWAKVDQNGLNGTGMKRCRPNWIK